MSSELHPHWKSTDRADGGSQDPPDAPTLWREAEEGEETGPKHVHVAIQKSAWPSVLSLAMAVLCLAALSVLFGYGIHRIRGDLLAEMGVPQEFTITDGGVTPAEATAVAGKKLEIRNDSSSAQQLESDQRNADGSPVLRTPLIPRGEKALVDVPADAAGRTLTLRSTLLPTLALSLSVAPADVPGEEVPPAMEQAANEPSLEGAAAPAQEPFPLATEVPIPVLPVAPSNPVFAPAAIPSSVPSVPAPPTAPPMVTIGSASSAPPAWPSVLRINRYVVGSPYVPPVHAVRYAEEAVREAVHSAAPREQPATGPALWISVAFALGAMPMVFWKRRKAWRLPPNEFGG